MRISTFYTASYQNYQIISVKSHYYHGTMLQVPSRVHNPKLSNANVRTLLPVNNHIAFFLPIHQEGTTETLPYIISQRLMMICRVNGREASDVSNVPKVFFFFFWLTASLAGNQVADLGGTESNPDHAYETEMPMPLGYSAWAFQFDDRNPRKPHPHFQKVQLFCLFMHAPCIRLRLVNGGYMHKAIYLLCMESSLDFSDVIDIDT